MKLLVSLSKGYLVSQLVQKDKQFKRSAKFDKEAADISIKATESSSR